MTISIDDNFLILCKQAYELDLSTDDWGEVEYSMVDLLKLVRSNPDQRDLFIRLFTEIYHGIHQVPEYLMAFCMRELRYAEIRSLYVNECAGDQNTAQFRRRMNHISHVMHAFDDEVWEDADMWSYYAHELREGGAE